MKTMKRLSALLLVCLLIFSASIVVYADAGYEPVVVDTETGPMVSVARAEQTEKVFRINPDTGRAQYRIWSITYGYWKTDWIDL